LTESLVHYRARFSDAAISVKMHPANARLSTLESDPIRLYTVSLNRSSTEAIASSVASSPAMTPPYKAPMNTAAERSVIGARPLYTPRTTLVIAVASVTARTGIPKLRVGENENGRQDLRYHLGIRALRFDERPSLAGP
jgi:hypothetical protein